MMKLVGSSLVLSLVLVACAGTDLPAASPDRESGQSALMGKTAAGANRCDPKGHERPFIIEWDATDMSSFEAKAATDVVLVKYEGCNLRVLDGCGAEVRGGLGAYGSPEWTSGSVERVDIKNEGELYAKLPLGASTLGGRVQAGEQFHMEYYVSGTRKATRDDVYRKEIAGLARCKGATHFVYAYNLGAFALASAKQVHAGAGGTVWGIGAGADKKSVTNAEKKGGVLTSCTGETAKETATCRVPIRLTLREIAEGDNPDATAARGPESTDALNLAGKVDTKLKMGEEAMARYKAAHERMNAGDGKACLKELDAYDVLQPQYASTNNRSPISFLRAACVMLSGMCDAGKQQLRKAYETQQAQLGPEAIDSLVEGSAATHCQGGTMSPRDQLLRAHRDLTQGAQTKKDAAFCKANLDKAVTLARTVKPKNDEDSTFKNATSAYGLYLPASSCFARAGDCDAAFKAWQTAQAEHAGAALKQSEMTQRLQFGMHAPSCKPWIESQALSPRDQLVKALQDLHAGARDKVDPAVCKKNHETVTSLAATVTIEPSDHAASGAKRASAVNLAAMRCLANAGDCNGAFALYKAAHPSTPDAQRRRAFESQAPSCRK